MKTSSPYRESLFLLSIFFLSSILIKVFGQTYKCGYDDECPSGLACYDSSCGDIFFMDTFSSTLPCPTGCCSNQLCISSKSSICLGSVNTCTSSSNCAGKCCLNTQCTLPSLCSVTPLNGQCTDSSNCQSKCCGNSLCVENSYCDIDPLNNNISNNQKKLWALMAVDIFLLVVVLVLFLIYKWRGYLIEKMYDEMEGEKEMNTGDEKKLDETKIMLKNTKNPEKLAYKIPQDYKPPRIYPAEPLNARTSIFQVNHEYQGSRGPIPLNSLNPENTTNFSNFNNSNSFINPPKDISSKFPKNREFK